MFSKKRKTIISVSIILFVVFFVILLTSCSYTFVLNPLNSKISKLEWVKIGSTPSAKKEYTPQGLTYIDGYLFLSESENNNKNFIYKLKVKNDTYKVISKFVLPPDAVHTSGLTWDGNFLWCLDYISKKLYKIDLKKSLTEGVAFVVDSYATGLEGPSANTYFRLNNMEYMAISDFMNSSRTYILEHGDYAKEIPLYKQALFSIKNKGFSQGLVWGGRYLLESTNLIGKDAIYQLDLCKLFQTKNFNLSISKIIIAPNNMVEDLAIDSKGELFTADEGDYSIYKLVKNDLSYVNMSRSCIIK